jgi:hypothetical protein
MDRIIILLQQMGTTADEVAALLFAEGVQGLRDSSSFLNPIVRYLNRNLDIGGWLEVGAGGRILRLQLRGRVYETALPEPVQEFLERFHQGQYPQLEQC